MPPSCKLLHNSMHYRHIISTISPSYWSYKPTLLVNRVTTMYERTIRKYDSPTVPAGRTS